MGVRALKRARGEFEVALAVPTRFAPCPSCKLFACTCPTPIERLRVELEAEYTPPTANDPDAKDGPASLPDQCEVASVRYPLMTIDRAHAGTWVLFVYWLALLRWRWLTRRG